MQLRAALQSAIEAGNLEAVQSLLSRGASPDEPEPMFGETPLMQAVMMGHVEICRELLRHRAKVNQLDKGTMTALDYAQHESNTSLVEAKREIVQLLVNAGAHLTTKEQRENIRVRAISTNQHLAAANNRGDVTYRLAVMEVNGRYPTLHDAFVALSQAPAASLSEYERAFVERYPTYLRDFR